MQSVFNKKKKGTIDTAKFFSYSFLRVNEHMNEQMMCVDFVPFIKHTDTHSDKKLKKYTRFSLANPLSETVNSNIGGGFHCFHKGPTVAELNWASLL